MAVRSFGIIKDPYSLDFNNCGKSIINSLPRPVLVVSTVVGKGIYSVAEAICERFDSQEGIYHVTIEELLTENALNEEYKRYRLISNYFPFLLNLVYRIPIFYYRKLLREKYLRVTSLDKLQEKMDSLGIKSVICSSHRPAFWFSCLKYRTKSDFVLFGMLSEFGRSLGWKYIFWDMMDGYLSPINREALDFPFPSALRYIQVEPPCKTQFFNLAQIKADKNRVLFVAGHWGQIFINKAKRIIVDLLSGFPELQVHVVCGTNEKLYVRLSGYFKGNQRVVVYHEEVSLLGLMTQCASIITKPGIATLLEAGAAQRKVFLLKGMPVAEDNNARYAMVRYGAEWFNLKNYKEWHDSMIG